MFSCKLAFDDEVCFQIGIYQVLHYFYELKEVKTTVLWIFLKGIILISIH